ncbi:MAG TPA: hypothetical protein VJZ26_11895 [Blastocatellia bacterium]|nr:hypothetical protein [Blastocatellia bacterium]
MPRAAETIEQRVTRRFYARFNSECETFSDLIKGVTGKDRKQHLASLLLIRLMFVRFVQSKGLLEGDADYLRSKLDESRREGRDRFYSRTLRPLFASERLGRLFPPQDGEGLRGEKIRIPDVAFERVFEFFDQYRWRLEEGPPSHEREITPDCMGRILELRINQKQMGAYYTSDDITEHIARNTIIPFLFDSIFNDDRVWLLLQANPDRYIYPAFKNGAGLPNEHERERLARRKRLADMRAKLAGGELRDINDVVTCNLDIRRFAQDVIETCESPRALLSFWRALESVTILDPTCGSGAFLFAALNILEPLYESCLERMRFFLSEPDRCDEDCLSQFGEVFERVDKQSKRSFILKAIIRNNLFGVDIMQEAVEICRLRFFLKLLARLDDSREVESLFDIDFRLRAGNALVGYVNCADAERAMSKRELDRRLARECGIDARDKRAMADWLASVKPFHWPVEFPEIIRRGGFDAVIGNPPYVSAAKIRKQYAIKDYRTANCPDMYAWALERACDLLRQGGRSGQVVPLSLTFSRDFDSCRSLIFQSYGENWFSSFARIPSALFNFDVRIRNTIHIGHKSEKPATQHTTRIHRWFEAARPHLFELIEHAPFAPALWRNRIPKLNTRALSESFERCIRGSRSKVRASLVRGATEYALHFKRSAYNWLSFCRSLPPCYDRYGKSVPHTKASTVYFADARQRDLAFLLLNGKIMLAFWSIVGDDFDLTEWMFSDFPLDLDRVPDAVVSRLSGLADELENLMNENVVFKLNAGKRVGNCNLAKCREVTDRSDRVFAEHLGIEDAWPDIELLYAQIVLTGFDDARRGRLDLPRPVR